MDAINYGKIPPQSLETEEAVLGSLMIEQDSIHKITGILKSESFYLTYHQIIFTSIIKLSQLNRPIDLLTVSKELKDINQLDNIGGPVYLTQLTSRVASAAHIEYHARIIQQLFMQRELIRIGTETVNEAFKDGIEIDELLSDFRHKISILEDLGLGTNTGISQSDVINEAIIELEKDCAFTQEGKQPGITTGLGILNHATGGWRNTNLIIIASRPAVGKTSLALHFAKKAAENGKWVNFYGFEMKSSDLMRTMFSSESGINRLDLRDGRLTDKEWDILNSACVRLDKLPIIWNDFAGLTSSKIKSNTIQNKKRNKCDLIIIDYLQLVKPFDKKAIREQQISEISRTLKEIALDQNIPIICLSQLSRQAANVKPELHHLRESGAIEQDADIVIFPWRNEEDQKFYLSIAKNRRGICGDFEIIANNEMTGFYDVPKVGFEINNFYEPKDKF